MLIDATHGAGVMKIDVQSLDVDFLVFPTYKWVLGPYGRAFIYIARRRQDGIPLEQTAYGRRSGTIPPPANGRIAYLSRSPPPGKPRRLYFASSRP